MRVNSVGQQNKTSFQSNLLVKDLPAGGDIGTIAVDFANRCGLTKSNRLDAVGECVEKNKFLIIDPETSLGKVYASMRKLYNSFYITERPKNIEETYNKIVKTIVEDKQTIEIDYFSQI